MTNRLLVHFPGAPADFSAAGSYLRTLAQRTEHVADVAARERLAMSGAFKGEAGTAFADRARVLADGADKFSTWVLASAVRIENVGYALDVLQNKMGVLRELSRSAGLRVSDHYVYEPAADAPQAQIDQWNSAVTFYPGDCQQFRSEVNKLGSLVARLPDGLASDTARFLDRFYDYRVLSKVAPHLAHNTAVHLTEAQTLYDVLSSVSNAANGDASTIADALVAHVEGAIAEAEAAGVDVGAVETVTSRVGGLLAAAQAGSAWMKAMAAQTPQDQDQSAKDFLSVAGGVMSSMVVGTEVGGPYGAAAGFVVGVLAAFGIGKGLSLLPGPKPPPPDPNAPPDFLARLVGETTALGVIDDYAPPGTMTMDLPRMRSTQTRLEEAARKLDLVGAESTSTWDFGVAEQLVLTALTLVEETASKVAVEAVLIASALGWAMADGSVTDAEVRGEFSLLSLYKIDA